MPTPCPSGPCCLTCEGAGMTTEPCRLGYPDNAPCIVAWAGGAGGRPCSGLTLSLLSGLRSCGLPGPPCVRGLRVTPGMSPSPCTHSPPAGSVTSGQALPPFWVSDTFDTLTCAADLLTANVRGSGGSGGPGRTAQPAASPGIWERGTRGFLPQFSPMPAGPGLPHPEESRHSPHRGPFRVPWTPSCLLDPSGAGLSLCTPRPPKSAAGREVMPQMATWGRPPHRAAPGCCTRP